jgi:hypothetical protein
MFPSNDNTCVRHVNGDIEAQQVKSFLEAHGIPCELRGESLRMTHGFTLDGLGVVRICVPESMVERAKELLGQVDAGQLALPDQAEIQPD